MSHSKLREESESPEVTEISDAATPRSFSASRRIRMTDKKNMKTESKRLISIFNENKLLILKALFECGDELCGCDLIEKLDIPKNLLSYHIKTLEEVGMIEETRCGKNKKYRIAKDKREKVQKILEAVELI